MLPEHDPALERFILLLMITIHDHGAKSIQIISAIPRPSNPDLNDHLNTPKTQNGEVYTDSRQDHLMQVHSLAEILKIHIECKSDLLDDTIQHS